MKHASLLQASICVCALTPRCFKKSVATCKPPTDLKSLDSRPTPPKEVLCNVPASYMLEDAFCTDPKPPAPKEVLCSVPACILLVSRALTPNLLQQRRVVQHASFLQLY